MVNRAKPETDENLVGFLLRLGEINFYDTPTDILNAAGLPSQTTKECYLLTPSALNLTRLATLSRVNVRDLEALTHTKVDTYRVVVRQHKLPRYVFKLSTARVCPECLRESNYCRIQWDLVVVTICPVHCVILLEQCPTCGESITWFRNGVSICPCGADWRKVKTKAIDKCETVVSRLICRALGVLEHEAAESNGNPLHGFDLAAVLEALFLIASTQYGYVDVLGSRLLRRNVTSEIHKSLLKAFSVFEAWPGNFHIFLDQIRSKTDSRTKSGLNKTFGNFLPALYTRLASPSVVKLIRHEFEAYISEHWVDGYLTRSKWFRGANVNKKYLTRINACRELNLNPRVLDRLVAEGRVKAVVKKNGKMRVFLVEAASIKEAKREFSGYLRLEGVSRLLGITRSHALRLIESSMLVPVQAPSMGDHNHWQFDKLMIQSFLARVLSKATSERPLNKASTSTFHTLVESVTRRLSGFGEGIHSVVKDILDGSLTTHELPKGTGLSRLRFSRNEVKEYLEKKFQGHGREVFWSPTRLKEFGMEPEVLYFLAAKGLIRTNRDAGIDTYKITPNAIRSFRSKYVFAAEIANEIGATTKLLLTELHRLKINPVSGISIDYGPQYVFRRHDIEVLDLSKLNTRCRRQKQKIRASITVVVAEAAKILSLSEQTILGLVENDVLRPYRDSVDSEFSYRFSRSYIEGFKGQFKDLAALISRRKAGRILGAWNLRKHWLKKGFVKYEVSKDGKKRFLRKAQVEEIASFLSSVVSRAEAGHLLGVHRSHIEFWTKKELLMPVNNRFTRALPYTLYSRAELANLKVISVRVKDYRVGSPKKILVRNNPTS